MPVTSSSRLMTRVRRCSACSRARSDCPGPNENGQEGYELIEAGNVFGAGALVMEGHRRLGTAQAQSDCRLIEMNREKFLFAVQESPMFAIELLASVDARLRDLKIKPQS